MGVLWLLILFLFLYYIGDYIFQSREMALNKSQDYRWLIAHCLIVFFILCIGGAFVSNPWLVVMFAGIYSILHGIQDWFIWRGYKRNVKSRLHQIMKERGDGAYEDGLNYLLKDFMANKEYAEDKRFYDTIGADSTLHTIILIILYGIIFL